MLTIASKRRVFCYAAMPLSNEDVFRAQWPVKEDCLEIIGLANCQHPQPTGSTRDALCTSKPLPAQQVFLPSLQFQSTPWYTWKDRKMFTSCSKIWLFWEYVTLCRHAIERHCGTGFICKSSKSFHLWRDSCHPKPGNHSFFVSAQPRINRIHNLYKGQLRDQIVS